MILILAFIAHINAIRARHFLFSLLLPATVIANKLFLTFRENRLICLGEPFISSFPKEQIIKLHTDEKEKRYNKEYIDQTSNSNKRIH